MTADTETRLPTPVEIGMAIKLMHGIMEWPQETLD